MSKLGDWWDQRTGMRGMMHAMLYEHIPGGARWRYVWGSTLVFTFAVQMITGFFLWMAYSPSSQTAWESVWYIQNQMTGGAIVRGIHHYTAQVMIVLVALHMLQVIVDGAYRAPREVNFWIGLVLLHIVLGLSLTGYLLPWDQKGYWATKVATSILASIPVVGSSLQRLVVGGPEYGHHTLTRFFALHAGLLPFLMIAFTAAHVYVFRRHGLRYKEPKKRADAYFWSDQVFRDAVACLGVLAVVLLLVFRYQLVSGGSAHVGAELHAPADPSEPFGAARPEWYFLFLFQFLKLEAFAGEAEWLGAVVVPGVVIALLFAMPLTGKWKWGHRFNIAFTILLFSFAVLLTAMAIFEDAGAPGLRLPIVGGVGGWFGLVLLGLLTIGALALFPGAISVESRGYRFGLALAVALLVGVALLTAYVLSGEGNRLGGSPISLFGLKVPVVAQKALLFGLLSLIALVLTAAMVREHAPKAEPVYDRGHELRHRLRLGVLAVLLVAVVMLVAFNFAPARAKEDFSHAVERAEVDAARVNELAGARGIPVEGAIGLMRADPFTQGPRLFARNCASCHRYDGHDGTGRVPEAHSGFARAGGSATNIVLAGDAANQEDAYKAGRVRIDAGAGRGEERMIVSYAAATRTATVDKPWGTPPDATSRYTVFAPQSAPDLAGFATRDWIAGMLDPAKVDSVKYFGPAMKAHKGKMVEFVKKDVAEAEAEDKPELQKIIAALSAEADLKHQREKDRRDEALVREGRKAMTESVFECTDCHDFRGKETQYAADSPRRGPDLTGYGSEQWLVGIISNPEHPRFYPGKKNDRMPLYGEKDILEDRAILLLARWLRGDERPVDAAPAATLAADRPPAATQPATKPAEAAGKDRADGEAETPVIALGEPAATPAPPPRAEKVDFVKQIKPIFEAHCVKCHGPDKTSSGYRLHTKELAFKRGDKAQESDEDPIVAGDSKGSLMFQLLNLKEDNDDHMPPKGKAPQLKKEQIELIGRWIDGGASWPDKVELKAPPEEKAKP